MESLKKHLDANKYIFECSQCQKSLDISDNNFYCKICKSNYCSQCIKGHNEVFLDHEVVKASEELSNNDSKQNSLLANPDLDLDDRGMYSEITMLFHETVVSLEENFNEELCKLKAKKNKENKSKKDNENNIIENKIEIEEDKDIPLVFNLDQLKKLEPLERIKKIMDIINKTNNK